MSRPVVFEIKVPSATGLIRSGAVVEVRPIPGRTFEVGDALVLPKPVFHLPKGAGTTFQLELEPSTTRWAYMLIPEPNADPIYFAVPEGAGPIDFVDLPKIEPGTLEPSVPSVPAWEAAVDAVEQMISGLADDAGAAYASAQDAREAELAAEAAAQAAAGSEATVAGFSQAAGFARDEAVAAKNEAVSAKDDAEDAAGRAEASVIDSDEFVYDRIEDFWTPTDNGDGTLSVPAGLTTELEDGTIVFNAPLDMVPVYTKDSADAVYSGVMSARDVTEGYRDEAVDAASDALGYQASALAARDAALTYRNEAQAATFTGTPLGATADANNLTTPGVYRVNPVALARNFPQDSGAMLLEVFATGTNFIQHAYPFSGPAAGNAFWVRRFSSTWSSWRLVPATSFTATPGSLGSTFAVRDVVNGTDLQIQLLQGQLGDVSLNTIRTGGRYEQPDPAKATLERGYPMAGISGFLDVPATFAGTFVNLQVFTPAGGNATAMGRGFWMRRHNPATDAFDPWNFYPSQRVDNTAGRAIYTWDQTANREQLIYGDTGWREIATLPAGWTGSVRLRRVGWTVEFMGNVTPRPDLGDNRDNILPLPAGFRGGWGAQYSRHRFSTSTAEGYIVLTTSNVAFGAVNGTPYLPAHGTAQIATSWTTTEQWPTTLPGTPVGGIPNL